MDGAEGLLAAVPFVVRRGDADQPILYKHVPGASVRCVDIPGAQELGAARRLAAQEMHEGVEELPEGIDLAPVLVDGLGPERKRPLLVVHPCFSRRTRSEHPACQPLLLRPCPIVPGIGPEPIAYLDVADVIVQPVPRDGRHGFGFGWARAEEEAEEQPTQLGGGGVEAFRQRLHRQLDIPERDLAAFPLDVTGYGCGVADAQAIRPGIEDPIQRGRVPCRRNGR